MKIVISKRLERKFDSHFSKNHILKFCLKVFQGLGDFILPKVTGGRIFKLKLTSENIHGRGVFLVTENKVLPLLILSKNDPIGRNMSKNNQLYLKKVFEALDILDEDLDKNNIEVVEI